jgi:hypothetical protein
MIGTFAAVVLGTLDPAQLRNGSVIVLPDGREIVVSTIEYNRRNLLLNAEGRRTARPGEVRIPVPVEGMNYEIIVVKPGEPKLVPAPKKDAD